jgi:hypothetical protein
VTREWRHLGFPAVDGLISFLTPCVKRLDRETGDMVHLGAKAREFHWNRAKTQERKHTYHIDEDATLGRRKQKLGEVAHTFIHICLGPSEGRSILTRSLAIFFLAKVLLPYFKSKLSLSPYGSFLHHGLEFTTFLLL